ncbi:MAG: response regulator [Fulvivirga sp.]|nr:response regulator [Fulvivirga sp.]
MGNVLVVDDEMEICLLLSSMMKKMGFSTNYATSLSEAREKLKESHYSIVFLDLNLPDGLGFHLIREIDKRSNTTKVIMISAYDGNIEQQRAKEEGADYFIPKPFSKHAVVEALEQLNVTN